MINLPSTVLAMLVAATSLCRGGVSVSVTLSDGSVLHGESSLVGFPLDSRLFELELPLADVASVKRGEGAVPLVLTTTEGDVLHGQSPLEFFPMEGAYGSIDLEWEEIVELEIAGQIREEGTTRRSSLEGDPTEFQVDYAGLRWDLWRTDWAVEDDRLAAQRCVRPGFGYGHWAHGRGGAAVTGIGDDSWEDYEVEFDFHMLPANREFYHAHIPGETRGMSVILRGQEVSESWNEPDTHYLVGINPSGGWGVTKRVGFHYPVAKGWSSQQKGVSETLGGGVGNGPLDDEDNRLRVRVVGNTISVWLNGELLGEVNDNDVKAHGTHIPYGGWGVQWRYESMGWIRNVEVRDIDLGSAEGRVGTQPASTGAVAISLKSK